MTSYDAQIANVHGKNAPDSFDPSTGRPPADFVVSRNLLGEPMSYFSDLSWDLSAYHERNYAKLNFQFWKGGDSPLRLAIAEELRWIMFLLIWRHPMGRKLSVNTLRSRLSAMRCLARRASARGLTIREAMLDRAFMHNAKKTHALSLKTILGCLDFLGPQNSGFVIADGILSALSKGASAYSDRLKQTVPIPTRIYSSILSTLSSEIEKLSAVVEKITALYARVKSGRYVGMTLLSQARLGAQTQEQTFSELLHEFGLAEFWNATGQPETLIAFSNLMGDFQVLLSLLIQAYTGMRAREVMYLPFDCLQVSKRDGDARDHYIVVGTTTKLNHGKEKWTHWITNDAAAEAIRIAQQLAQVIYASEGVSPIGRRKKGAKVFLFPCVNCDGRERNVVGPGARPSVLKIDPSVRSILSPIIQDADQLELFAIDPNRAWDDEEQFKVGAAWRLQTHQLRRSLALYAQSSGLVSLPSLKRQLQHITIEMSLYYAKGSAFALNFIGEKAGRDEKHFGYEWQEAQPVSQYLAYAASILLSNESEIFGGHGQWLKTRMRDQNGQIMIDREETMKSFQKGEIAYRPTPLGGCVNPGPCDENPLNVLSVECIGGDCRNLLANRRKVERVILVKMNTIKKLKLADPHCAELRIEKGELRVLQAALVRAEKLG